LVLIFELGFSNLTIFVVATFVVVSLSVITVKSSSVLIFSTTFLGKFDVLNQILILQSNNASYGVVLIPE